MAASASRVMKIIMAQHQRRNNEMASKRNIINEIININNKIIIEMKWRRNQWRMKIIMKSNRRNGVSIWRQRMK
jgi:hypothetical protein